MLYTWTFFGTTGLGYCAWIFHINVKSCIMKLAAYHYHSNNECPNIIDGDDGSNATFLIIFQLLMPSIAYRWKKTKPLNTWWLHQMETFSALLAICAGNSPASGEFPTQSPVTHSFDVFFDLCLNKWFRKQSWGWWFETLSRPLWRHCHEKENITRSCSEWSVGFPFWTASIMHDFARQRGPYCLPRRVISHHFNNRSTSRTGDQLLMSCKFWIWNNWISGDQAKDIEHSQIRNLGSIQCI